MLVHERAALCGVQRGDDRCNSLPRSSLHQRHAVPTSLAQCVGAEMRLCGACGKPIPKAKGNDAARRCCDTERCRKIYFGGKGRTRCLRCCINPLPKGRAYQRLAICMSCIIDINTILGPAAHP
jgi:hypothetical protein